MAKLLLIDDEKEILEGLELILSAEGYQTQAFESAQTALSILMTSGHDKPDLIIADAVMPGMNGLEFLDAVRNDPAYADLPVLFISASITPEKETEIAQLASVTFLRKPFQVDVLCSLVETLCHEDVL